MGREGNSFRQDGSSAPGSVHVSHRPSLPERVIHFTNSGGVRWISIALLLLSVFAYYPTAAFDYDIWFHLRYGAEYAASFSWDMDHSRFSWTPADTEWKYVTWIGSSLLYGIYHAASMPGLYLLQWTIFLSVFALFFFYVRRAGDTFEINHILWFMMLAVAINPEAQFIKPELFSILFFTFAVCIYFAAKSFSRNLFFLYPALFLVWVNTHGGFIIGLFFVSLLLCGEVINYLIVRKQMLTEKLLRNLVSCVALAYAATLINPHGPFYHIELAKDLFSNEFMGEAARLFAYKSLWGYLFPEVPLFRLIASAWSMLLMSGILVAASFAAYKRTSYLDITIVMVNLIFFVIGMQISRTTPFFPLIWFLSTVHTLREGDIFHYKKRFGPASLAVIILWACVSLYHAVYYVHPRSWFGSDYEEFIPVKEAAFVKKYNLPKPLFNDYLSGAYILWTLYPEYRVFIDSRFGPYVREVWPDYIRLKQNPTPPGFSMFTAKYPFRTAFVQLLERDMLQLLLGSSDWRLLFFDKVAAVFVHRSAFGSLAPEVFSRDLSAARFRDVTDPAALERIFNLFVLIQGEFGLRNAREMLDIFRSNVSDYDAFKQDSIMKMEQAIESKMLPTGRYGK